MFTFDAPSLRSTLAIRLRFLNERTNRSYMSPSEIDGFTREVNEVERDIERVEKGETILCTGRELLMGYRSDLDDTDQPYKLYIPNEYDGSRAFPLAVYLHGQGMFNPLQCWARPIGQMIVVAPQARGGTDYRFIGETDTLCVIDEVQRLLRIDADRVYLCGESMGGTGSWQLAAMFPDRFAGIMALCGATDIRVWAKQWLWHTPKTSPLAKVRDFLRDDTSSVTYAPNMEHVNVICLQGECDPIVNDSQARHMEKALKAAGHKKSQFHFLPFVTHSISANYNAGLQKFAREARPLRVRYKTAWLKYPGAYWLKIDAIGQRLKHATIEGSADPKKRSISIKTSNVNALSIELARLPFKGRVSRLKIDEQTIDVGGLNRFVRAKNRWVAAGAEPTATVFPPPKNRNVEGPVEHALMSRFLLVAPGAAQETHGHDVHATRAAAHFNEIWRQRYAVDCRRAQPEEVTETDASDSNLILFGRPEENALTARVIDKLPLSFKGDEIRLGERTYAGPNAGVILCYPNPLNPNRYVVLIAGTAPRSYVDINVRFGNWFDWVPYDFRKHYDFAIFDDLTCGRNPESFLVWGFFGESWEFVPATTFPAVKSFREKLLPRVVPSVRNDAEQKPEILYLDEAVTLRESVTKEYLERNRTLEGQKLQLNGKDYARGLCCRFPCSLTFDCAGYGRLKMTVGVGWDGRTEPCNDRKQFEKARITVQGDAGTLFEIGERTYKLDPCEIDIDLNGSKTVTLSANGGLAWLNGSIIWANARLER
jgi:acetyl esterase/lipase